MKAMICKRYGSPVVLHLEDVKKPVPKDNEILVKVKASSVNALDWHFMRGKPFLVRLKFGLFKPKNRILGYDIAGIVEQIGKNVHQFKPGDEVFGGTGFGLGGFAEYVCISESRFITTKPENISFQQAASVPGAGAAALIGLCDRGKLKAGQKVLINGSSGGTGTFAVQIAKAFNAEVTAVCSTEKVDMVRKIGADHVIDYSKEDFTLTGKKYDLFLDNVGNRPVKDIICMLNPGGTVVIVGFTNTRLTLMQSIFGPRVAKSSGITWSKPASGNPTREHADILRDLLASAKVVPEIEKSYTLEELPSAMRHIETGHARAKIVVTI